MISTILTIIGIILAVAIVFWLIKSFVKAVIFVLAILIIAFIIFAVVVTIDATAFKKDIAESKNTFLVVDDNGSIQGVSINKNGETNVLDKEYLSNVVSNLNANKLKEVIADNANIIVVKKTAFDNTGIESIGDGVKKLFVNSKELITNVANKNIQIYPKRSVFEIIQNIPLWIVKTVNSFIRG